PAPLYGYAVPAGDVSGRGRRRARVPRRNCDRELVAVLCSRVPVDPALSRGRAGTQGHATRPGCITLCAIWPLGPGSRFARPGYESFMFLLAHLSDPHLG